MSKIEEAAREFIQNDPILKHGILEDEVPKLMADFATSQPFNLDVPVNYDKFANKNKFKLNEKSFKPEWIAECKEYQKAKTVREKIAELNEDNEQLENDLRNMANLVGFQSNQIEQLTQERDEFLILLKNLI
jgi:hypothetical protein